jgi:RNA polymerase sigma-70 factor (ECF subfamily)
VSRLSKQLESGDALGATLLRPRADELGGLARAAAAGEAEAAATLVMQLGGSMLRVVRKVLGRRHPDVDDVTQDAVIAFLQALVGFRGDCSVERFAQRVALLTALSARRRLQVRHRERDAGGEPVEELPADDLSSPHATAVARRRRGLVRRLLDDLPDVIGEALALHFILDYTVEEIAAALAVPANTVWSRLRLGKRALRRRLDGDARLAEMLDEGLGSARGRVSP